MQTINTENVYLDVSTLRLISFWRKKDLEKKEIRTSFNIDLYLKVLEAKNS
jgi:hypothetical protein